MIACWVGGGLGNQLFQYATARSLSLRLGAPVLLDTRWYRHVPRDATPRHFELGRLRVAARVMTLSEELVARAATGRWLSRVPLTRRWKLLEERGFGYDPRVMQCLEGTYLRGYWQSPRYFEQIRGALLEELQPLEPLAAQHRDLAQQLSVCPSVAVHVRRGDYVSRASAARFHGTCGPEYYREAFALIARKVREPRVFVFSDDIEWARRNLPFAAPTEYLTGDATTGVRDLWLMAACRHNIIANSSYSWWGAWLGSHPEKVVVAPRCWFAAGVPVPDLIPEEWCVL